MKYAALADPTEALFPLRQVAPSPSGETPSPPSPISGWPGASARARRLRSLGADPGGASVAQATAGRPRVDRRGVGGFFPSRGHGPAAPVWARAAQRADAHRGDTAALDVVGSPAAGASSRG